MKRVKGLQATLFLFAIAFIFIGPNFRIFYIPGYYFLFYTAIIVLYIVTGLKVIKVPFLISIPFIATFLSLITKFALGEELIFRDVWFTLRYFDLIIIYIVVKGIFNKYTSAVIFEFLSIKVYTIIIFVLVFISVIALMPILGVDLLDLSIIKFFYSIKMTDFKGAAISNFEYSQAQGRTSSIFLSALSFATILMYLLIFITGIKQKRNIRFYLIFTLSVIAMVYSDSRAAIISFTFALLLLLYFGSSKKYRIFKWSIFLFAFVVILINLWSYLPFQYFGRFEELLSLSTETPATLNARLNDIELIYHKLIINDYWISGIPLNEWGKMGRLSAGNQMFTWFQYYGVYSIILILWYIYLPFYFWKQYVKTKDIYVKRIALVLFAISVAGNISNVTQVSALLPRAREFIVILMSFYFILKDKNSLKQNQYVKRNTD